MGSSSSMSFFRPKEILRPLYLRFTLIPHAIIGSAVSYGAAFDRVSFDSPVYGAMFEWISLTFLGIMFFISALMAVYVIISGSWKAYFLGNVMTFSLSLMWLVSLVVARFQYEYSVSTAWLGLWSFILATCILLAATPTNVVETR